MVTTLVMVTVVVAAASVGLMVGTAEWPSESESLVRLASVMRGSVAESAGVGVGVHVADDGVAESADEDDENDDRGHRMKIHVVYNLGCDGASFWEWQAMQGMVLDHSWRRVYGPNAATEHAVKLTRVITGCEDDAEKRRVMTHGALAEVMFVPGGTERVAMGTNTATYVYFNRAFAMREFLTRRTSDDPDAPFVVGDDEVVMLIDPDFVFRRRINEQDLDPLRAGPGTLVAASYGMDPEQYSVWGAEACSNAGFGAKRCRDALKRTSLDTLLVGVPYAMWRSDWLRVLDALIRVVPEVFAFFTHIEADMYALGLAIVVSGVRSVPRNDWMAHCMANDSSSVAHLEKQNFLHLCSRYAVPETRPKLFVNRERLVGVSPSRIAREGARLNTTHWFVFDKHWLKGFKFYACESPLLAPPPPPPPAPLLSNPTHAWHRHVAAEAVEAYNSAFRADKRRANCSAPSLAKASKSVLVMRWSRRANVDKDWVGQVAVDLPV